MTAQLLENFFVHEHNQLAVAEQEYEAAKLHFREVLENRVTGIPEHEQRFRDAVERQDAARDRYVELLAGQ